MWVTLDALAQPVPTSSGTGAPFPLEFIQYGVLGLVIVALLMGWLWAKPAVDRMLKDKERAEQQRDDLLKVYEDKVMPALAESSAVVTAMKPIMEEVVRVLSENARRGEPHGYNR